MGQAQRFKLKAWKLKSLSLVVATVLYSGSVYAEVISLEVNLPTQSLQTSIERIAQQGNVHIVYLSDLLQQKKAPALRGKYTIDQALEKLLQGTNLTVQKNGNVYTITSRSVKNNFSSSDHKVDKNVVQLSAITVRAEHDNSYDQPRSITVINRKQLEDRPAKHAADMLEQSAGVYSSVSQQDPALSVNIRGIQDFGRVNMNIDGMRQNFQKTSHGARDGQMYIDSELLSAVKIEKGATNSLGSAGTLGGIATFTTVNADEFLQNGKDFGGKLHVSTGTNASKFIGSAIVAGRYQDVDVLLGISERKLGDYNPGKKGNIGDIRTSVSDPYNAGVTTAAMQEALKNQKVSFSNYEMQSGLFKVGWNIDESQRLQFSYLQTNTDTPNAGMITAIYSDPNNTRGYYTLGWKNTGFSQVSAKNFALDYSLKPVGQDWLDLKAKIYHVDTKDNTDTYSTSTLTDNSYSTETRLKTYGLQLENTSRFQIFDKHLIQANYGLDFFYDKNDSHSSKASMEGVTPKGNRWMASIFSNLIYNYDDWLKIEGGLRYDRYRLRGNTSIDGIWYIYDVCTERRASSCTYKDTMSWHVDREEGKLSPTFALGIKPGIEWLEIFANYGKAYRPPAITETLVSGSAHSSATVYPNPYAQAERSESWEVGFNVNKQNLFVDHDQFNLKIAYFDTRVDNYISLATNRILPGYGVLASSGYAAYVNNLLKTQFKGIEYQLSYDADIFYANLSYSRILGKNDFCSKAAWLGNKIKFGGEAYNWYPVEYEETILACSGSSSGITSGTFSNLNYLPSDRGSLTLGGRLMDHRLDFGAIIRYNKGRQDHSVVSSSGAVGSFYVADWPKYTLLDLYASYQVNSQLKFSGSVENLMDRAYVVAFGDTLSYTLGRGRTFIAGLEYKF
ncbi:TonB-dependent receptor [Acinetobacter qingfengensis]|uniref:TonB-dependent receptor n=1 Tax=Acinetobacter qingfengensis TaxID=1262585 RepID=A0A1E7R1N7_9GAMM|nr:TonB-dependent receptor [Acinetobacter qingfengensis]OEY93233.1 TonB-dependent receptor [Acinetobacter qingfengensis]